MAAPGNPIHIVDGFGMVADLGSIGFELGSNWVRIGFVLSRFREASGECNLFILFEILFRCPPKIGFVLKNFIFVFSGVGVVFKV
jgi:hypothetical protein